MITPIIMLVLVTMPYLAARALSVVKHRNFDARGPAAIGLGMLFMFTGIAHFIQTEPMAQMLPPWVLWREALVYLTGVLEFAIAVGFFVPALRRLAGWTAATVFILFFPENIYAAINYVPMGGHAWGPPCICFSGPRCRSSFCFGFTGLPYDGLTSCSSRGLNAAGELFR